MTSIKIILIFALALVLTSCGQTKTANPIKTMTANSQVDTSVITIFPYDSAQYWIFKNVQRADLTSIDIGVIETSIEKCLEEYNLKQEKEFREMNLKHPEYKLNKENFIIDFKRYKRQYIAVTNRDGEKEVWVNCFCYTMNKNWKTNIIQVKDGGNCFFNLKINLTTLKYYDLMVNGDA